MPEVYPIKVCITYVSKNRKGGNFFSKTEFSLEKKAVFLFNSQLHSVSLPLLILTVGMDFDKKFLMRGKNTYTCSQTNLEIVRKSFPCN